MGQPSDQERLAKPPAIFPCGLRGRRPWVLAIAISIVFHLTMGWTLFEAGVHWPTACCEPVDTRVAPPIDAVVVDLSDPLSQTGESAEPARRSVPVTAPVAPKAQTATGSNSAAVKRLSDRRTVDASGGAATSSSAGAKTGRRATINSQSSHTVASRLHGLEIPHHVQKIVFVVDRSASMGPGGALERAVAAVAGSIASLPVEAQFQVVFYNRRLELLPTREGEWLWHASSQAKTAAIEALHHWRPEGGTDHLSAIRAALGLKPDVIYWLTDGADLTAAEMDSIARSNKGKAAINTIGMGPGSRADGQPLQKVALGNRGLFRQLLSTGD